MSGDYIEDIYVHSPQPGQAAPAHNVRVKLDGGLDVTVAHCPSAEHAEIVAKALRYYGIWRHDELVRELWDAKLTDTT